VNRVRFAKVFSAIFFRVATLNSWRVTWIVIHYFKSLLKEKKDDIALPAPHGPLSSKIPPGAIEGANERVSLKLQLPPPTKSTDDRNYSRYNYLKVSDAQRLMIAKRASQFGTTALMRYFTSKYPDQICMFERAQC